jgi:hypothetical protein
MVPHKTNDGINLEAGRKFLQEGSIGYCWRNARWRICGLSRQIACWPNIRWHGALHEKVALYRPSMRHAYRMEPRTRTRVSHGGNSGCCST